MEFFKKLKRIQSIPEDKEIDKKVEFALTEKEQSLDDFTDQLNFHVEAEGLSNEPNLSENESDGSEATAKRIEQIKEALEYYESMPANPKIQEKIIELKSILKRIDPHSVLIDPNLN